MTSYSRVGYNRKIATFVKLLAIGFLLLISIQYLSMHFLGTPRESSERERETKISTKRSDIYSYDVSDEDQMRNALEEDIVQRKSDVKNEIDNERPENNLDTNITDFFHIRHSSDKDPLLNLHKYEFSLTSTLCERSKPDVVIFVHSATFHWGRRKVIRKTWGRYTTLNNVRFVKVFMLGRSDDPEEQRKLELESEANDDIVQGNFMDTYSNLTYKHIMGIHWVLSKCSTARLFVKVDDDVLVNVFNLVEFISKFGFQSNFLYCGILKGSSALRDKRSKWFVSKSLYPFDIYPDFCVGLAYLISPDVAKLLHKASEDTRFYWVDDVYVTGILPLKVGQKLTPMISGHLSTRMKSYHRSTIQDYMFLLGTQLWKVLWKALLRNTPDELKNQV